MADEMDDGVPLATNTLSRMGERLAALEGRTQAQIASLQADTTQIRQMGHELRTELQNVVAVALAGQTAIRGHMEQCERRAARQEKIGFLILTAMIAALGFLVAPYLHVATASVLK